MASSHVCCVDIRKAYVIYAVNTQNCRDEEESTVLAPLHAVLA